MVRRGLFSALFGLFAVTTFEVIGMPAEARELEIINSQSSPMFVAVGLYPVHCVGFGNPGCFSYKADGINVRGWWKVNGKSSTSIIIPDELYDGSVYISAYRNGRLLTDSSFRTKGGNNGGHKICVDSRNEFSYRALMKAKGSRGGYGNDDCSRFFVTRGWQNVSFANKPKVSQDTSEFVLLNIGKTGGKFTMTFQ